MKFVFQTHRGKITDLDEDTAHRMLHVYAGDRGLDVHQHPGNWAGNAVSTAYAKGGDSLTDVEAVVRPQR